MRAQDHPLDFILKTYTFAIPDFQRPFSWTAEQLDELWDDLVAEAGQAGGSHFIGTIVLELSNPVKKHVRVWDGQQRLASIVILLASVRDYLISEGSAKSAQLASEVHSLIVRGGMLQATEPTITLGGADQKTFEALVLKKPGDDGRKTLDYFSGLTRTVLRSDWSQRVVEASSVLTKHVQDLVSRTAESGNDWQMEVVAVLQTLLNRFELIVAETTDANDAFVTFQTLNDRGLGLSAADLLKNYFLSESQNESDRADASSAWDDMALAVGSDMLPTYLRHFYMTRYGLVGRPRLYKTMLALTKGSESSPSPEISESQLLTDITDSASIYVRLTKPTENATAWLSPQPLQSLQVLEGLGATQWSPLLLAANMIECTPSQMADLIRAAECLVVREVTVIGKNPNAFEKVFANAAQTLWKKGRADQTARDASVGSALALIAAEMSSDELFSTSFLELSLGTRRARVLLDALERLVQQEELGGVRPDHQVLDVEHIYPKTDREGWPKQDEPGFLSPANRNLIGNLTLLHLSANRSQKNAPFTEKIERFKDSKILLTSHLADGSYTKWESEQVKARQAVLLKMALKRWPLSL